VIEIEKKEHLVSLVIAISAGLFIVLAIAITASGGFNLPENSGGWFYEYQTLFSGVFAAAMAALSVYVAYHNYKNDFKRKEFSAIAHMNDALSDVCTYSRTYFNMVKDGQTKNYEKPTDSINALKNAIEFLDGYSSETVFELVSFYQVYNSRLESYLNPEERAIGAKDNILYDSVKLYALSSRLFSYARKETDSIKNDKLTKNQMFSALNATYGHSKKTMAHDDKDLKDLISDIENKHK